MEAGLNLNNLNKSNNPSKLNKSRTLITIGTLRSLRAPLQFVRGRVDGLDVGHQCVTLPAQRQMLLVVAVFTVDRCFEFCG
jgi:hypothetical protein